jgi:cell division protein FtsB
VARARGGGGGSGRPKRGGRRKLPLGIKVALYVAGAAVALSFAIEGGEYGTTDLIRQRTQRARLTVEIDSLRAVRDSLESRKVLLETDAAMQERIAREEFGLVRGERELLYRFVNPEREPEAAETRARP